MPTGPIIDVPAVNDGKSTDAEIIAALEDLFRKLPADQPHDGPGIPYLQAVDDIGRQLLLMAPSRARRRTLTPKKAQTELLKATSRLFKVLDLTPAETLKSLDFPNNALRQLRMGLVMFHRAALIHKAKSKLGAPTKSRPAEIAAVVSQHYYGITGKKPTVPRRENKAYGPFLELLKTVFEILDVSASAEAQANAISRQWKPARI
jgi:hypothetical protein